MTFKTLIIGTGFGTRVVRGCYEEAGMEVTVVSPRDPESVRQACADSFDLVSVHSPSFLHSQHVNWALDSEKNVLCDKPFGVSSIEARQMYERALDRGVIHLLNFEFRLDPARARLKELLDSGVIGTVTHINWQFFHSFTRFPPRNHKWQFERDTGGWVRMNGPHMFDALRWLVGEIVDVTYANARLDVIERPDADGNLISATAEDAFVAALTLDNGASVIIDTAQGVHGNLPDRWTIVGTDGMIEISEQITLFADPMTRDTTIRLFVGGVETLEHFGPFPGDGHLPALRPFAKLVREAVSEKHQIEPSFAAGLAASEVTDRVLASFQSPYQR